MEFSRPEYWSGYPFPSTGDLPNPGMEPRSPRLQVDSLPLSPQESPKFLDLNYCTMVIKENVLMLRKHTEVVRVKEA